MHFWKHSLTARLAASFLLLSLLTVGVMGLLAFVQARNALQALVVDQLAVASEVREDGLRRWLTQQQDVVSLLSRTPELRNHMDELVAGGAPADSDALRVYLQGMVAMQRDIDEVALLDERNGQVLLSTRSEHEGTMVGSVAYMARGRQDTYVQPAYLGPDGRPTMTIAMPLVDAEGRRRVVLAAHLNLLQLNTILQDRSSMGRTGEAYLVAKGIGLVAGSGPSGLPPAALETPGVQAAFVGAEGVQLYRNYAGTPVIGAYCWLEPFGLAVVVERTQAEAFAPAQQLAVTILVAGALCATLLAAAVWFLAQRITRPLVDLTRQAAEVANGDLRRAVPVLSDDETGVLARSFNRMTERLRVLYGELQGSEEHFRSLIEHASDVILIVGRGGEISYDSPSVERSLGYSHAFLRGQRLAAFVHPDECPELLATIDACFAEPGTMLAAEFRLRDARGAWRVFEGRGQWVRNIGGAAGIVINARDISDRKRAEEERLRLQDENLRVRSEFIATVSHELRTPLTPIRGYVDLLLLGAAGPLGTQQQQFVEVIRANTLRMQSLVDDLLDIGRVQAGKIMLNYDRLDLGALVQSELRLFSGELERKGLALHLELDGDLPPVYADGRRVSQMVVNLVSNAVKYTYPHGDIWVRLRSDEQFVEMEVEDTGIGLDGEQQARLFTPFYRADNGMRAEVGGTGLGLCIVKSFVELHGGTISVRSVPQQGSLFSVRLPITRQEELARVVAAG